MYKIEEARKNTKEARAEAFRIANEKALRFVEDKVGFAIFEESKKGKDSVVVDLKGMTAEMINAAVEMIKETGYEVLCGKNDTLAVYWN